MAAALCGCKTGELENRLDDMEKQADIGSSRFFNGQCAAANSTFSHLASQPTVSAPLYKLDEIPPLIFMGRANVAFSLMKSLRADLEELYDPEAEKRALSKWHGEVNKVFKGNPHEMQAFYALLSMFYANEGEYEDAWRCVQNGLLHDSDARNEKYRSDDALLLYLGSVYARKLGEVDAAEQCRRRLKAALDARGIKNADTRAGSAYVRLLDENAPDPNVFVVSWTGTPPQYGRAGKYGEVRTILKGDESAADLVTVKVDDRDEEYAMPAKMGDINYQATTVGGREMDNVLAGKANFKQSMENFQTVSIGISGLFFTAALATFDTSKEMLVISVSLAAAGVAFLALDGVFYAFYDKTDPRADIRSWKTLPGQLNVLPLRLEPGEHTLYVRQCVAGDVLSFSKLKLKVKDGDGISVGHFLLVEDSPLDAAVVQLNNDVKNCMNTATNEFSVVPQTETEGWDASACYAITGSEPFSRFKLVGVSSKNPFLLWNALIRHGYYRHWSADFARAGRCAVLPDVVLLYAGDYTIIRKQPNGTFTLDTRVDVVVRDAVDMVPSGADADLVQGREKSFHAWSRLPCSKTTLAEIPAADKAKGVEDALNNLFKMREFREALLPRGAQPTLAAQGAESPEQMEIPQEQQQEAPQEQEAKE